MDKILKYSIISLIMIVVVGFAIYIYLPKAAPEVQNSTGGTQTELQDNQAQPEGLISGVEIETESGDNGGGLTICFDKCGDGICEEPDSTCTGKLNCPCVENPQECPQDCK